MEGASVSGNRDCFQIVRIVHKWVPFDKLNAKVLHTIFRSSPNECLGQLPRDLNTMPVHVLPVL